MDNQTTMESNMTKTTELEQQSSKDSLNLLKDSNETKQELANLIYDSFHAMNVYGRQPESLKSLTKVFMVTLEDCNNQEIRQAFRQCWKTQTTMPTPAEILKIINKQREEKLRADSLVDWKEELKRKEALYGAL